MYVYEATESGHWFEVGFYTPTGQWVAENQYATCTEAADRVAWLNGSGVPWLHFQDTAKRLKEAADQGR